MLSAARKGARGLTLLELMVVVAIIAMTTALAAPGLRKWSANAQMRTAANTLQTSLRFAQAEAVRSYRQVVFYRTNATTCTGSEQAAEGGSRWVIKTIPLMTDESSAVSQCGTVGEGAPTMSVSGPTAVCFSPLGRPAAVADPGIGGTACGVGESNRIIYAMGSTASAVDTDLIQLQVWVSLGGNIRMCDSNRALDDATPEGCPATGQSATS